MAFFKFRKGGDEHPTPTPAAHSVDALRKRARHRLIGAAVLVLAGVIGFPLLFDNQPRPIAVDIPIEIPDKNKVKPLVAGPAVVPAAPPSAAVPEKTAATPAPKVSVPKEEIIATSTPPKVEVKKDAKPVEKPVEKPKEKTSEPVKAKVDEAAKAQALLEGKEADSKPAASTAIRFIVQVGAYTDAVKMQEVRSKLEKAGLKTYTQVITAPEGKRTRVRVGPFETRTDVDKVAEKIKKLDLPAAILEL
jgi:DedD protein